MQSPLLGIVVQPSSGVPIYRQLMDQIRALAAGGRISVGQLLPSVRQVAEDLSINMMTVSKAYGRLEAEGVLERDRGVGMRISPTAINAAAARQNELAPLVSELVARAQQLSLSSAQVVAQVKAAFKDGSG